MQTKDVDLLDIDPFEIVDDEQPWADKSGDDEN